MDLTRKELSLDCSKIINDMVRSCRRKGKVLNASMVGITKILWISVFSLKTAGDMWDQNTTLRWRPQPVQSSTRIHKFLVDTPQQSADEIQDALFLIGAQLKGRSNPQDLIG